MTVIGSHLLSSTGSFKGVLNESGAFFFASAQQHRDMKVPAVLSYEDDSRGNALAAVFVDGRCEIRHHDHFTPERVRTIWSSLLRHPELAALHGRGVSYGGKSL